MKPVIQEDKTGCAIACAANVAGVTYQYAKKVASEIGIQVDDCTLWSEIQPIRKLLARLGFRTANEKKTFRGWGDLPSLALLSIKWHEVHGRPYWHWVLFVRQEGRSYVIDPNKTLKNNVRTDFGRMKPKWYIEVFEG